MCRIHSLKTALVFALALGLPAACGDETDSTLSAELARHQALWAGEGLQDYRFNYEVTGFDHDPNGEVTVTVRDGAVVDVERRDGTPVSSATAITAYAAIEGLFERMAEPGESAALTEAEYDDELGYPTRANFENSSERWGFELSGFVVIDETCLDELASCTREHILAASAARWIEQDSGANPYCLERSESSFTGFAWRSWSEVVEGEIDWWRLTELFGFDDTVGDTQEGSGRRTDGRVASLNELYARCRDDVLTRSADAYDLGLELDATGLLESCYATELGCADDCTDGVVIDALNFEACERSSE